MRRRPCSEGRCEHELVKKIARYPAGRLFSNRMRWNQHSLISTNSDPIHLDLSVSFGTPAICASDLASLCSNSSPIDKKTFLGFIRSHPALESLTVFHQDFKLFWPEQRRTVMSLVISSPRADAETQCEFFPSDESLCGSTFSAIVQHPVLPCSRIHFWSTYLQTCQGGERSESDVTCLSTPARYCIAVMSEDSEEAHVTDLSARFYNHFQAETSGASTYSI